MEDGTIQIENFSEKNLRGASYMLRLGGDIAYLDESEQIVDLSDSETYPDAVNHDTSASPYILKPGAFVLGGTIESVKLSNSIAATLRNLSGLSRLGIAVEIASFVSPGYGHLGAKPLTLEIRNFSSNSIKLVGGIPICHIIFWELDQPASSLYDVDDQRHSLRSAPGLSQYHKHFLKPDSP